MGEPDDYDPAIRALRAHHDERSDTEAWTAFMVVLAFCVLVAAVVALFLAA